MKTDKEFYIFEQLYSDVLDVVLEIDKWEDNIIETTRNEMFEYKKQSHSDYILPNAPQAYIQSNANIAKYKRIIFNRLLELNYDKYSDEFDSVIEYNKTLKNENK